MIEKTICFTGHRNIPVQKRKAVVQRLKTELSALINNGYQLFMAGGDGQVAVEKGIPKDNIEAIAKAFIIKGKYVPVSSKRYRLYSALWCAVRPIRGYIFKIARLLKRR